MTSEPRKNSEMNEEILDEIITELKSDNFEEVDMNSKLPANNAITAPNELIKEEHENKDYSKKSNDVRLTGLPDKESTTAPIELFEEEHKNNTSSKKSNDERLKGLLKYYFEKKNSSNHLTGTNNFELEVRFGTRKGSKPISKNDFENVIQMLKNSGFDSDNESGTFTLKMTNEFLNGRTGTFQQSNTRVEINTLHGIQEFCKSEKLSDFSRNHFNLLSYLKKTKIRDDDRDVNPVNVNDFNFRAMLQIENNYPHERKFIEKSFNNAKKTYRYLNRITFRHPDFPFKVELSVVKSSKNFPFSKFYNLSESNVFSEHERYEIEIEAINSLIGHGNENNNFEVTHTKFRKVIKIVLSGMQKTRYPVSIVEQESVLQEYMKMLYENEKNYKKDDRVYAKHFIGPSSQTLLMKHLNNEQNSIDVTQFVATDKADGERCLMYISESGRIYLITQNMQVIFTGTKSKNKKMYKTCLDGELILRDKHNKFINLYAAFDIYYLNNEDIRVQPFFADPQDKKKHSRHTSMNKVINDLDLTSVVTSANNAKNVFVPIRIIAKKFYPESQSSNVFAGCKSIFEKINNDLLEYKTDGLIISPMYYGVGSDKKGAAGPKAKVTWDNSFKWKPPELNTIDFMVEFAKDANNLDVIKTYKNNGVDLTSSNDLLEYQQLNLLCSYNEKNHGPIYINPYEDVLNGNFPEFKGFRNFEEDKSAKSVPLKFYPIYPADEDAGVCNLPLEKDKYGTKRLFTLENEPIDNHSIVEFAYDLNKEKKWRWVPLRLRRDKIFGNALTTARNNWESIHNPISESIITGESEIPDLNIDDDVYYNKDKISYSSQPMKDFHNLYVKRKLISSVSKKGDMLIDYACGLGGDLPKWIHANLSFVLGIDLYSDSIENRNDGICVRYLESQKKYKSLPVSIFLNGDSAVNIRGGDAALNPKASKILKSLFGTQSKDDTLGKVVSKMYGKMKEGFHVSSCQFAFHYFFQNHTVLRGFMTNLAECTKIGGYFIGTTYDGKKVFQDLKSKQSLKLKEGERRVWEIRKHYTNETFDDDSSCLGYRISVYQDSINQEISEYLVNFNYLKRVMEDYGFVPLTESELHEIGLKKSVGSFQDMFNEMIHEISSASNRNNKYKKAQEMSKLHKTISFYNNYFVFKKIRSVNVAKITLDTSNLNEENNDNNTMQPNIHKDNKERPLAPLRKRLLIEEDSEED
tara:strand:+ start:1464 stop:5066 length:3603 start_codon:yes stop_codon:yes gene_type:complete